MVKIIELIKEKRATVLKHVDTIIFSNHIECSVFKLKQFYVSIEANCNLMAKFLFLNDFFRAFIYLMKSQCPLRIFSCYFEP